MDEESVWRSFKSEKNGKKTGTFLSIIAIKKFSRGVVYIMTMQEKFAEKIKSVCEKYKDKTFITYMKEDDSIISMVNSNLHKEKIRSRFGYSSTMDTRFCFVYQLSQRMMT